MPIWTFSLWRRLTGSEMISKQSWSNGGLNESRNHDASINMRKVEILGRSNTFLRNLGLTRSNHTILCGLLILLMLRSVAVGAPNEAPPTVPADVVLKPTFMTGYDSFSGGTAFLCTVPGVDGTFLLTAQHLFGPACGLERQFTWQEVPKTFIVVTALSITEPKHFITSTQPLAIPGGHALDDSGYDHDLAAYRVDGKVTSLRMAAERPKVGEPVFLYARQRGKTTLDLLRAIVRKSSDSEFEYNFDDEDINLAGTSGAPVLNGVGEVVALNIGGGEESGKHWGMGNPCNSISSLLKAIK